MPPLPTPTASMPIRQYSSHNAMRQADGPQQLSQENGVSNSHHHGHSNGAYQKIFPPIGVQDFQKFPTGRSHIGNMDTNARARVHASSSLPSHLPPSVDVREPLRFDSSPNKSWGSHELNFVIQRSKKRSFARPSSSDRA